jgi:hypothetical protein
MSSHGRYLCAAAIAVAGILTPLASMTLVDRAAAAQPVGVSAPQAHQARRGASVVARPSASLVPQRGALLGAWVDDVGHWVNDATAEAGVARLEQQLGRKLNIDQHYYGWTEQFPTGLERGDLANGRIPLISWGGPALGSVVSGANDAMIRARADSIRALGSPVFLRWAWEMNGNWSPYDGTHSTAWGPTGGPRMYVQAWRRIHTLFAQEGATNVVWVWSPNGSDVPAQSWNHWSRYYPGDAYVDWVGVDAYNWGNSQPWSSWSSLSSMIAPIYADYGARKPIMVAETASTEQGGDKAAWLKSVQSSLQSQFPSVAALVYFDQSKETNWRVDSSPATLAAFRALASDPYFNP